MDRRSYIGQLRQFRLDVSDWPVYKPHLFSYFTANEIRNAERQRAVFLNALDEGAYRLMLTLCRPNLPEDTPFSTLVSLFDDQFAARRSVFAERYKFYRARKYKYESVRDWADRVKKLAAVCRFGSALGECVRDKFIFGFSEEENVFRLLGDDVNMSFDEAVKLVEDNGSYVENYYRFGTYCPCVFHTMFHGFFYNCRNWYYQCDTMCTDSLY